MISFKELVKAGVHFGHQTSRWMPKMDPYIWGVKNKVHLIDVSKTAHQMERAAEFLKQVSSEGKQVLWVGTKKPAREIIQATAQRLGMPFVNHRWIGGTLSNYSQVKKSVTRLLHYEDILAKADSSHHTKKELNDIQKNADKLRAVVGGIRSLTWPVGALVVVDVNKEQSAIKEAVSVGVPIVGLVDTNSDPSLVDYVIPANDDAPRSIKVVIDYLADAVDRGKKAVAVKKEVEAPKEVDVLKKAVAKKTEEAKPAISAKPKVEAKPKAEEAKPKVAAVKEKAVVVEKKAVAPSKPKAVAPEKEEKPSVKKAEKEVKKTADKK